MEQAWSLDLHLVVAYQDPSDSSKSRLVVTKPFAPNKLNAGELLPIIPPSGSDTVGSIQKIFMVRQIYL